MFRLPDIKNRAHLVSVGESIFEELARQQIEGSLETGDMVVPSGELPDTGGFNFPSLNFLSDFDITKIRVATPIEIGIDDQDVRMLKKTKGMADKTAYLVSRGYNPRVAGAIASAMGKFSTTFYTKAIEYRLSATEGFTCAIDFINWIELPESLISF